MPFLPPTHPPAPVPIGLAPPPTPPLRQATLRVPYLPTARNAPVRRFLQALARVAGRSPTVVEVLPLPSDSLLESAREVSSSVWRMSRT